MLGEQAEPREASGEGEGSVRLTAELLEQLLASATPEQYLARANLEERSLAEYADAVREAHGLKKSQVIRASGLNPTFCYQIFEGARRPGRDSAIMLAFGLGCSLVETQRLLRLAGASELWSRNRRDAIIIFCLEHGMDRAQTDDELWRLGEKTLIDGGA